MANESQIYSWCYEANVAGRGWWRILASPSSCTGYASPKIEQTDGYLSLVGILVTKRAPQGYKHIKVVIYTYTIHIQYTIDNWTNQNYNTENKITYNGTKCLKRMHWMVGQNDLVGESAKFPPS